MGKALDKWENIQAVIRLTDQNLWDEIALDFCNIKRYLVALDIVTKRFTIQFSKSDLPDYYGIMQIGINPIYIKTKEEYELLKEVLL